MKFLIGIFVLTAYWLQAQQYKVQSGTSTCLLLVRNDQNQDYFIKHLTEQGLVVSLDNSTSGLSLTAYVEAEVPNHFWDPSPYNRPLSARYLGEKPGNESNCNLSAAFEKANKDITLKNALPRYQTIYLAWYPIAFVLESFFINDILFKHISILDSKYKGIYPIVFPLSLISSIVLTAVGGFLMSQNAYVKTCHPASIFNQRSVYYIGNYPYTGQCFNQYNNTQQIPAKVYISNTQYQSGFFCVNLGIIFFTSMIGILLRMHHV